MDKLSYDEIFKNILSITGNDLSKIEQIYLIFHTIYLKHNFSLKDNKYIDNEWNKEYGRAKFEYTYKNAKISLELKPEANTNNIQICIQSRGSNNNNTNFNTTLFENDEKLTKINFENLSESIKDLENFVKTTYINEIDKSLMSGSANNFNVNQTGNVSYGDYNFYREPFDPNNLLRSNLGQGVYNPMTNPYFSTGGGSVGGNLVGPTSDIFTGHMNPQPMSGIHPTIRYDPIGPFGTYGGPQKKDDKKATDPFKGGNPFGSGFPPNGRGPFGGNPFG
jgi:hypothetical protein